MEELEPYAAGPEHLVQRREDDIPHPCAHPPEERPAIGEEHPHGPAERHAGGETRPADVAVLVGEREVVDAAQEARVERFLGGAVQAQPVAPVVVVDRVEASGVDRETVHRGPAKDGEDQVDHMPDAPQLPVSLHQLRHLSPRGLGEAVDQAERCRRAVTKELGEEAVDCLPQDVGRLDESGRRGEPTVSEHRIRGLDDGFGPLARWW